MLVSDHLGDAVSHLLAKHVVLEVERQHVREVFHRERKHGTRPRPDPAVICLKLAKDGPHIDRGCELQCRNVLELSVVDRQPDKRRVVVHSLSDERELVLVPVVVRDVEVHHRFVRDQCLA